MPKIPVLYVDKPSTHIVLMCDLACGFPNKSPDLV